jgi:hypothetical protein
MIHQPHVDSYSVAGRVCLAVAVLGLVALTVVGINSLYFLR